MIKKIQEETGATVEIDDDGTATISCEDSTAALAARQMIEQLTAEVEVGRTYEGRVVSIKDFGAFVEVLPGQEGLCHVSELDVDHVREVSDVVSLGDVIPVKVILRDEQGRLKLSRRAALEGDGDDVRGDDEEPVEELAEEAGYGDDERPRRPRGADRPRGDSPPRDRGRGDRDRDRDRGDRGRGDRDRGDRGRGDRDRDGRSRGGRDDRPGGRSRSSRSSSRDGDRGGRSERRPRSRSRD